MGLQPGRVCTSTGNDTIREGRPKTADNPYVSVGERQRCIRGTAEVRRSAESSAEPVMIDTYPRPDR